MSDIKCLVCGEPWNAWGANHGDMLPWEYELFRQGAGCPCCEGKGDFEPQTISDIYFGDEDLGLRMEARRDIPWRRPEPPVLWQCDGCGVTVVRNPDDNELEYDVPMGAKCRQWYNSHAFWRGEATEEPAHVFEGGQRVCEFCLSRCDECGREISSLIETGDVYDDGASFNHPQDWNSRLCVDCLESLCDECECQEEEEEDDD